MAESAEPPFLRVGPLAPASPVVLSVPHSGSAYSAALLAAARLPRARLETLEDPLVDRLIWRALGSGAVALVARSPRAEIDLNRDERELDPALIAPTPPPGCFEATQRTRSGLGLVPSRIAGAGGIWLNRLPQSELTRRIETIHRPYHRALERALRDARERFGAAVLLDCHSMPPRRAPLDPPVVLGDLHGASCAPGVAAAAAAAAEAAGFRTAMNAPYAGGHITCRHGRPGENIHALQIEVDRSLYLAPDLRTAGAGFDRTARMLAAVVKALACEALDPSVALAAE